MNDDKTRISGGFQFGGSLPDRPPEPIHRPGPADDLWLVVESGDGGRREYPLRPGERLTVGREASQQVLINDKTLSRHHLVMQRLGDAVQVQVVGLNGLEYNNQTFKSTTIELPPSASFLLGRVACRIRKQVVDADATVIMPERSSASGAAAPPRPQSPFESRPVAPAFSQSGSSVGRPPQDAAPPFGGMEDFSRAPRQPAGAPAMPDVAQVPSSPPSSGPAAQQSGGFYFGGSDESDWAGMEQPSSSFSFGGAGNDSRKKWLLIGGAGLGLLLVVGLLVFFLMGSSEEERAIPTPSPASVASRPPAANEEKSPAGPAAGLPAGPAALPQTNNLHGRYISEAFRLYQEGSNALACDYLMDIPPTSAYRQQALELAEKLGNCRLND